MGEDFRLRVAHDADAGAVTGVLSSAYTRLMAADYDPAVLAAALPAMTQAQPDLLASGTYYVQEVGQETGQGQVVACGGWTRPAPGPRRVEDGVAHVRHLGAHADWTRRSLAAGILDRCKREARASGVHTLQCFSSLGAEAFYAAFGFTVTGRMSIAIGGTMTLPMVAMGTRI